MKNKCYTTLFAFVLSGFMLLRAETHIIQVSSFNFDPSVLTVVVGDEIRWEGDLSFHPLRSTSVPEGAAPFSASSGTSFSYTVTHAGTYHYQCNNHHGDGMIGQFTAELPTGVLPGAVARGIIMYPSRTTDLLNIDLGNQGSKPGNYAVDVYSPLGKLLFTERIGTGSPAVIHLEMLNRGIYLVAVRRENEVLRMSRIVKD